MSSTSYSPTFSLVLPSRPTPSIRSDTQDDGRSLQSSGSSPLQEHYLSHLRPLFPPAPFTPSHPVFVHLSSIATAKSQEIRSASEERLAQAVRRETEEIEEAEVELRREVEILWKKFRESVDEQQRSQHTATRTGRRDSDAWSGTTVGENSLKLGTVAIRDFVPIRNGAARSPPSKSAPHMSSLSASLVTSSFHHPRGRSEQQASSSRPAPLSDRSPPAYASNPPSPASSLGQSLSSPSTSSSRSLSARIGAERGPILAPFKRNMDQQRDAAASFRYFTIEAEMEKANLAKKQQEAGPPPGVLPPTQSGSGEEKRGTNTNGVKTRPKERSGSPVSRRAERSTSTTRTVATDSTEGSAGPENTLKGKRKVTFDVKPDIVTIKREVEAEKKAEEAENAGRNSGGL